MKRSKIAAAGILTVWAGLAQAATVSGLAVLPAGTDGLITFNDSGLANNTEVTDQFMPEGATFLGLFLDDGFAPRNNTDGALLFRFGQGVTAGIQFVSPVRDAFFALGSNNGSATFTSFLNGALVESFTADITGTALTPTNAVVQPNVFGFQGSFFDEIRFTTTGSSGFSLDNVAFNVASVPLPAGLPLLLAGLAGFAVIRRRQRDS